MMQERAENVNRNVGGVISEDVEAADRVVDGERQAEQWPARNTAGLRR
jgi:hypothetical protein